MLTSLSLHIRLLLLLLPPGRRLFAPREEERSSNSSRIMRSASSRVTCTSLKYPRPASLVRGMYMRVKFEFLLDEDNDADEGDDDVLNGEGDNNEAAVAAAVATGDAARGSGGGEDGISMNGKCAVVCRSCRLSVFFIFWVERIGFEAVVWDAGCNERLVVVVLGAFDGRRPKL